MESLSIGGRIAIISFHSLEDRMVKRFFKDKSSGPKLPRGFPVMDDQYKIEFKIIGKPVKASKEEIEVNARSRSAIMRTGEKLT